MAEAKGKKVSRLPRARKGKGKPSEPKLKKKTVRALNEAYNRRKIRKRHPDGWEPVVTQKVKRGNRHPKEKRHNYAPLGRPPEGREARKEYNAWKREETPYQKALDKEKEKRAMERTEAHIKRLEAKAKKKDAREQSRAKAGYHRNLEEYEKEEALRVYSGWSINELRSDCKDYGISDERKDWMKMSKKQLAVWLYKHRGSAHRTFYER